MKQLECHFKIMATRWRYSGRLNLTNKNTEKAINTAQSRGHFLDLNKREHPLVKYLLRYSTITKVEDVELKRHKDTKPNEDTVNHNHTVVSEIVQAL